MIDQLNVQQKAITQANFLALFYLIVACLILSTAPIGVRWSEQEISPIATVFMRFLFATLVFGVGNSWDFIRAKETSDRPTNYKIYSLRILLLLLGAGMCSTANQIFWAWSLVQTKIGISSLMHSLTPLFTTLFAWLFLKRSFDRQFLMGMAIAIGGSIAIGISDMQMATIQLQGDLFALLSSIFFGGYLLIVEQLRVHLSVSNILFWRCLFCIFLLLPILLLKGDRIIPYSWSGWWAVFFLVLVFVIGHGMLTNILKIFSSSIIAVAYLLEPFGSSLQAWVFFAEKLSIVEWIGFAIVIFGVYVAVSSPNPEISE
ncbi:MULTISPECIES: DMT family transporter [Spirulina sp. CCY15215]|uniref:DMT family transporter n=1 Tax=Spirulina sp. CCY15215 TaxID=2767591 RepID=UPI001951AE6C|nr:DMT family transporter [Spirulina major]